ncbi:MAG: hypothetical protein HY075_10450 [Deltaproteobacteria bacterium]|nr:hypothetical protein [Deltaproteobacteria bacterium]
MQKQNKILISLSALLFFAALSHPARASADRQAFYGFSPGLEVVSNNGSGTGFYIQGFGGYAFSPLVATGLHLGYSNVGGVGLKVVDFGGFLELKDDNSGLFGKVYLDGMNASASDSTHGVSGSQLAFAPGVGLGMLIPSAGSFHLVPEVNYRVALFSSSVNVITMSFGLMWDL